jgi:hypothetical protein
VVSKSAKPKYFLLNSERCCLTVVEDCMAGGGGQVRGRDTLGRGVGFASLVLTRGCGIPAGVATCRAGVGGGEGRVAMISPGGHGSGRQRGREGPGRRAMGVR